MKKIHLVCNAHLDPVWLWRKSEGMTEAMATFRIAADFCERYEKFIFTHGTSANFVDFCYRDNLCSAILNRVNHVQHRSYTHINQIFCRYEKAILINGEILNRGYHVVLNKAVFKYFLKKY